MKTRIIALVIGLSLPLFAAHANDILAITETGENFDDLVATFNGAPLNIALTNAADNWFVELPAGFSFAALLGTTFSEPEDPSTINLIFFTGPTSLNWVSEVGGVSPNKFQVTIVAAGTGPGGLPFDLVLADTGGGRTVPDSGTTMMLLGSALTGIGLLRRYLRG